MNVARPRQPRDFDYLLASAARGDAPAPHCQGEWASFVDYKTPPTNDEADEMCLPCPLFFQCRRDARSHPPEWGVRGGEVYIDRRRRIEE